MGRPQNLERFLRLYHETKCTLPIWVIFDEGDLSLLDYSQIKLPLHWKKVGVPNGTRLGSIYNIIFKTYPNEDFYGMVSDDCEPQTECWDVKLRDACIPDLIAWPNDGFINAKMPTFAFLGGDLVRKLGFWSPGDMQHWYTDNAWADIAYGLNKAVYRDDIKLIHLHPVNGNAENDKTYNNQPNASVDKLAYDSWKRFSFPSLIERMKAA